MHIEHLAAFQFRNLEPLAVDLTPGTVVVRGDNAQGKTNLLEALYVCATGKSFRQSRPRDLLTHRAQKGSVRARLQRHGVRHAVEVTLYPTRRTVRIDDRGVRSGAKLLELVNVVAFFPDDLRIVKGSPEQRRRFLDRSVANHRPEFVDASVAYAKSLKSRNALLRSDGQVDPTLLRVYDRQLIEHGTILYGCRKETLEALIPGAGERFSQLMGVRWELSLNLISGLGDEGVIEAAAFAESFAEALERSFPRDRARRMTTVGPHRGDLAVSLDGHLARDFASQGQQRTIVLALKLSEVSHIHAALHTAPVLLLDDVSSELDSTRTAALFGAVEALDGQVWISTTGTAPLPLSTKMQVFEVRDGRVREVS